jgi:hypothetical protein
MISRFAYKVICLVGPSTPLVGDSKTEEGQMTPVWKSGRHRSVSSGIEVFTLGAKLREVGVK